MFQIITYRNPHSGQVFLLTPTEVGMQCIMWFSSWADFKIFIDGLAYFEAVEERQGQHDIPEAVLDAFGEKERNGS